jgi:Uma2 family endonuclease
MLGTMSVAAEHEPQVRPLHLAEYLALDRQGFFDDEHVELLDGRIYVVADEGPPHAAINARMNRALIEGIPVDVGEVRVGSPLHISDLSSPQPDFSVVVPSTMYRAVHPTTALLVVEVAHSSRAMDLGLKATLYAAAGITDYWVVDVTRNQVVVHRDPDGPRFATVTHHDEGVVTALHVPTLAVDVGALLR